MNEARLDSVSASSALVKRLALANVLVTMSAVGWALVAIGLALRLIRFADNRALWLDEAMLSLNLIDRSLAGVLRPLDYAQAAPPLFLLPVKLTASAFGYTEWGLRLVPLLAGIAALLVFRSLAMRLIPGIGGLVALAVFAVGEPLVAYSAEVKHYSMAVLATVGLLYVASEPLSTGRLGRRRAVVLGATGILAVLASYPAVFVMGGVVVGLVVRELIAVRRVSKPLVAMTGAWLAASMAAFLAFGRPAKEVGDLALPDSPASVNAVRDLWQAFSNPTPFARTTVALAVLMAALGAVALKRRSLPMVAALAATVAATLVAGQASFYPLNGRFVLFLVPVILLFVGAGVQELRDRTAGRGTLIWTSALVLLLAYPAGHALLNAVDPVRVQETRDVLGPMEDKWRPGDTIYVARLAGPILAYYALCEACGGLDGQPQDDLRALILSARSRDEVASALRSTERLVVGELDTSTTAPFETYVSDFARFRGEQRVWFVMSRGWDHAFASYTLDCLGRPLERIESTNAAAYLYDLSRRPVGRSGCFPG